MAFKTRQQLLDELPVLIKKSLDTQVDKTTGTPGLHDIVKDIIDSLMVKPAGFPVGSIINWSGSISDIPANWVLCDGTNRTPNLRDRFVPGATGIYPPGSRGGSANHVHSGVVGGHSLTVEEIPPHSHGIRNYTQSGSNRGSGGEAAGYFEDKQTDSAGKGNSHVHPFSGVNSQTILPPYWALAFIMFKGLGYVPGSSISITIDTIIGHNIYFTISGGVISAGLNIQYSSDSGGTWSTLSRSTSSPQDLRFIPSNGMWFRIQSKDSLSTYSNDWIYSAPTTTTTTLPPIVGSLIEVANLGGGGGPTQRIQIFKVGPSVKAGEKYKLTVYSHTVTAIAVLGDNTTSITDKLIDLINNTSAIQWNDAGSAPPVGTPFFKPSATYGYDYSEIQISLNVANQFYGNVTN